MSTGRLAVAGVLLLLVIGLGATGFFAVERDGFESSSTVEFDADAWRAASLRDRGRMVDDLVKSGILDGKTRAEVVALLGTPDLDQVESIHYEVDIGIDFGSQDWLYLLSIRFDENGRVSHAYYHD